MEKIGVSQKAIIFNKEGKFLTLQRTNTAPSNPNKWDLPGGDLDFGEDAIKGITREIKEETGLEIENIKPFDVESHINNKNEFWVTIAYTAKIKSDKIHPDRNFCRVKLSFEHNDFKWVTKEEFLKLESSEKLKRFVKNL